MTSRRTEVKGGMVYGNAVLLEPGSGASVSVEHRHVVRDKEGVKVVDTTTAYPMDAYSAGALAARILKALR